MPARQTIGGGRAAPTKPARRGKATKLGATGKTGRTAAASGAGKTGTSGNGDTPTRGAKPAKAAAARRAAAGPAPRERAASARSATRAKTGGAARGRAATAGATVARRRTTAPVSSPGAADSAADAIVITHPERVVYPAVGISKGEVVAYYRAVAPWLLPEVANRPLSLLRCPDGSAGECFFQKHGNRALGDHVQAIALRQKSGTEDYLYIADLAGLLELVQMNTLELHPWGATVADPEHPDRLVFDLDPGEGVSWTRTKSAARDIRARLRQAGLESFVRLSGGKGLHVVVPIVAGSADWDQARDFCEAFAQALATQAPDRYVATMRKAKRTGVIFVDWLRNGRGNTSVCSWSLRARAQATVAVPLRWEDLARIASPQAFPLAKALQRAARLREHPWKDMETLRQRLPGT